jgi:hypothetical protein
MKIMRIFPTSLYLDHISTMGKLIPRENDWGLPYQAPYMDNQDSI